MAMFKYMFFLNVKKGMLQERFLAWFCAWRTSSFQIIFTGEIIGEYRGADHHADGTYWH